MSSMFHISNAHGRHGPSPGNEIDAAALLGEAGTGTAGTAGTAGTDVTAFGAIFRLSTSLYVAEN